VPEVARLVMAAARGLSEDLGYQNSPDAKREPVARPASGSGRLKGRRS
jgi:hypothetical protein